jgi:SAM-dependent methyltransferase
MRHAYEIADCPVCGTAQAEMLTDAASVRAEMESLWLFHTRRIRPAAHPARFLDRAVFSQHPPLALVRCIECGVVRRNPRERARDLVSLYAGEELDEQTMRVLFDAQLAFYRTRAARITDRSGGVGAGLEVGSYIGAFLAAAREQGWEFEGVDVNPVTNGFARGMGLRVTDGSITDIDPRRRFRAIAIWNCFDQLPDPRVAVAAARERLHPGGVLAIRVPNGGFYAAWSRRGRGPVRAIARAMLAQNNLLGFPYRHGFTPSSLRRLLQEAGFRVIDLEGGPLVPTADRSSRSWAVWEERAVKGAFRVLARLTEPPWFDVYARAA